MRNGSVPKKTGKMRKDPPRNKRAESVRLRVLDSENLAWKISHFRQYRNLTAKNPINMRQRQRPHQHLAMTSHPETAVRTNPKWMRCDAFYMPMEVCIYPCLFSSFSTAQLQGGYYFGSVDQERFVLFGCLRMISPSHFSKGIVSSALPARYVDASSVSGKVSEA
jgi:hypothetical protein